jgi:hypothetical protein
MHRQLRLGSLAAVLAIATAVFALRFSGSAHAADPSLVIDAGISGNQANAIGTIENCISVPKDTEFQMDVIVRDVSNLLAWETYLDYDGDVVSVTDQNVKLFQQANLGSSVLDISDRVPDSTGFHHLAAFDSSDPPTPDSGIGILARVTFKAVGSGDTKIRFGTQDLDNNGVTDKGTLMRNSDTKPIGDTNGDNLFDGQTTGAEVAVDQNCPAGSVVAPAPVSEGSSGGSFPWFIAAGIAAAAVVVSGAGGAVVLSRRRSRGAALSDEPS